MSASQWPIENERLTIFWAMPGSPSGWSTVVGGEPDRMETQKLTQVKQESRTLGDAQLVLLNSPGRTDLVIQAVGPFAELKSEDLAEFFQIAQRWIRNVSEPVIRLALGRVVFNKVSTKKEGYETLKGLIKSVTIDSDKMVDLLYQVNWPTVSSTDTSSQIINRVTKWMVLEKANVVIANGNVQQMTTPEYFVRLEIDISTPIVLSGQSVLDRLADRVNELRELAKGVQEDGEPR